MINTYDDQKYSQREDYTTAIQDIYIRHLASSGNNSVSQYLISYKLCIGKLMPVMISGMTSGSSKVLAIHQSHTSLCLLVKTVDMGNS